MDRESPLQIRQREFADMLLFDYYLQSSVREEEVISPYPHYLDGTLFREMTESAGVLYCLILRIISDFNSNERIRSMLAIRDFPFRSLMTSSKPVSPPFFWVRFDAFVREAGGVFFTECNFDKPCGQREILISEDLNRRENREGDRSGLSFRRAFLEGFTGILKANGIECGGSTVAVLTDPSHREEMHAALLFIDLLRESGCHFVLAGGNNVSADGNRVCAFGRPVDVILRQYPAEYLYEIRDCEKILQLNRDRKVLILNDLHAAIGQAKSVFALCWELLESDDPYLDWREREVIESSVPHTRLFGESLRKEAIEGKDGLVLKAVFGRYSEQVFIGRDFDGESWRTIVDSILQHDESYVLQQFIPMRPERLKKYDGQQFLDLHGYVNYGIYLIDGEYHGISARCTPGHLTREESVWFAPVCLRDISLTPPSLHRTDRDALWEEINDEVAFDRGLTEGYTNMYEYFVLQPLILKQSEYDLIKEASTEMTAVFKKAVRMVQQEPDLLLPLLGIPDSLREAVCTSFSDRLTFLGRMDWVFSEEGDLRLLELNSETPAGLVESLALNGIIRGRLGCDAVNPNENMASMIVKCLSDILGGLSRDREITTVGFVSCAYREDWYSTRLLFRLCEELPFHMIMGEVSGLEPRGDKLALYGTPLDALYRFYPLMWLAEDRYYRGVIEAFTRGTPSINEPSTLICQSKAFFAMLWEMARKCFFSRSENEAIMKYIPETCLAPGLLKGRDYFVKPYFGLEGERVVWSGGEDGREVADGCVYQQRIQCQTVPVTVHSTISSSVNAVYPVIGAYIIGDDFGGVFTRGGGFITDKWAVSIPTYVDGKP